MKRFSFVLILGAVMQLGIGSAHAAVITPFVNLALWQAAVGGPTALEDFTDAALVAGLTISFGSNIPGGSIGGGVWSDTAVTQFNDAKNPKVNFAPSTKAFGADWDLTPGGAGDGVIFAVHLVGGGATYVFGGSILGTHSGFFGIVSDTAFDQIRFDSPGTGVESFNVDNARFATGAGPGAVPEPGTLILLGSGLAGAYRLRRHKKTS